MSPVGSYLRELRQQRSISLEAIARTTRVAYRYLDALESDDLAILPAPVFTRGFIRAYCQALGVAPEEALARYSEPGSGGREGDPAHGTAGDAAPIAEAVEAARRGRGAVLVSFVLLVVLGVALFAMTLVLQAGREGHESPRASALATTPTPPEQLSGPADPTLSPPPATPTAEAAPKPATAPGPPGPPSFGGIADEVRAVVGGVTSPYRLVARTSEPTWVRVRTEDGRVSEETMPTGQSREWVSNRPFVLTIGNAGGIALELNGRALPRLGPSGAVINGLVLPPHGP